MLIAIGAAILMLSATDKTTTRVIFVALVGGVGIALLTAHLWLRMQGYGAPPT